MRKIFSIIVCVSLCFNVNALEIFAKSKLNIEDFSLDVEVTTQNSDNNIVIMIDDKNILPSGEHIPKYAYIHKCEANEKNIINILLPNTLSSGKCFVYSGDKLQTDTFYNLNPEDANTKRCIEEINNIKDKDTLKNYLENENGNAEYLGIDISELNVKNNINEICKLALVECSMYSKVDAIQFYKSFYSSVGMSLIKSGENLEKVIDQYGCYFGADVTDFSSFSKSKKDVIENLIKNSTEVCSAKELYNKSVLLADIIESKNAEDFMSSIIANADAIGLNIGTGSNYLKIREASRYRVFVKMREKASTYKSIDELREVFEQCVNAVIYEINSSDKEGSPGSGKKISVSSGEGRKAEKNNTDIKESEITYFKDLTNHFSCESVKRLYDLNIVNGYSDGTFKPNNFVTRAEFVKMIIKALDIKFIDKNIEFKDVNEKDWFYNDVCIAASNNLISGYNGMFSPNIEIKREDAAVIINNALDIEIDNDYFIEYTDASDIEQYALNAVKNMHSTKIMMGLDDGSFCPKKSITRGEAAVVIDRLICLKN